jgi:DNA-binding MarR family transcriptional regulator
MSRTVAFGIVGGNGATGRVVVSELWKSCEGKILIGGGGLTPGSISVAVDRLVERGLVSRVECPEDRRVRVVSLTPKGKELITPVFRKHAAEIRKVFANASPRELRNLEIILKRIGKCAESLGTGVKPRS